VLIDDIVLNVYLIRKEEEKFRKKRKFIFLQRFIGAVTRVHGK
jgi:hypothetical protein